MSRSSRVGFGGSPHEEDADRTPSPDLLRHHRPGVPSPTALQSSRGSTTVNQSAGQGALSETSMRSFDDVMLQRRYRSEAAAATPASGIHPTLHGQSSPQLAPTTPRRADAVPVARHPKFGGAGTGGNISPSTPKRLNRKQIAASAERLCNDSVQQKKDHVRQLRGELRQERKEDLSFRPELSPFVRRQQARARQKEEAAQNKRRIQEQLGLEDGGRPSSVLDDDPQIYLVDEPHFMSPLPSRLEPPPPTAPIPKLTARARAKERSVYDLFEWKREQDSKRFGDETVSQFRYPRRKRSQQRVAEEEPPPPSASDGSESEDDDDGEDDDQHSRHVDDQEEQARETAMKILGVSALPEGGKTKDVPVAQKPVRPRPQSSLALKEAEELKRCTFRPRLSRRSETIVRHLGDRRITAEEHAVMSASAVAKESLARQTERVHRKLRDMQHYVREEDEVSDDDIRMAVKKHKAKEQKLANDISWFIDALGEDLAYRQNSDATTKQVPGAVL